MRPALSQRLEADCEGVAWRRCGQMAGFCADDDEHLIPHQRGIVCVRLRRTLHAERGERLVRLSCRVVTVVVQHVRVPLA